MSKRILSIILTMIMVLACVPTTALFIHAAEGEPTIYVMEDVYGKPGETVAVKVGFKNITKNIQQFQIQLTAGEAAVVSSIALPMTPAPEFGGTGFATGSTGEFGFACGAFSFTPDSYVTVYVTIPESATVGDEYALELSPSPKFVDVLKWEGGESAEGNIAFEGATLFVADDAAIFNLNYEWEVIDEAAGTARLLSYVGDATEVAVPSVAYGDGTTGTDGKEYTVVELFGSNETFDGVFSGNETVTSITIPESVKVINEYAITECTALTKLVVKSPDLEIVENDGETFLHYFVNKKTGYIVPEELVIYSYESATSKIWADEYGVSFENLFAFVGAQQGDGSLRFIGAVSDLDYRKVDLEIAVAETSKTYKNAGKWVYTTLNGTVNGEVVPVVTTSESVATETGAELVSDFTYLYGYAIEEIPATGTFTFTVTPSAITEGGVTVYGKSVTVTYINGQLAA